MINLNLDEHFFKKEIQQIKFKGIDLYLKEKKTQDGFLIKKDKTNFTKLNIPKGVEFEYSDNFYEILICLVNSEPFKIFFIDKPQYKFQENYIVTYYFRKIMKDLWNQNYDESINIGFYIDFKEKIKKYCESNEKLIEFIIQNLYNENTNFEFGDSRNTIKKYEADFFPSSPSSIFKENFFFYTTMKYHCPLCKKDVLQYYCNCCLMIQPKIDKDKINIYDLLNQKIIDKTTHMNCEGKIIGNQIIVGDIENKRKIENCPKYLIIVIDKDKDIYKIYNCKFQIHEIIKIKDIDIIKNEKKKKLELYSFIYNKSVYVAHKNQLNQKEWFRYIGTFLEKIFTLEEALKIDNNQEIPEIPGIPDILIYKLIK